MTLNRIYAQYIANIIVNHRVGHAVSEFDTICILALRNDYTSCLESLMHASGGVEDSEEHGISVSKKLIDKL